jgi:uncharacterized repeat protein (TIGR02059 family)
VVGKTIKDTAGNLAAYFNQLTLTNSSTYDVTAPVLSTLETRTISSDGNTLTLTFNEAIGSTVAATSAFTVRAAGATVSVTGVTVSGNTAVLTLGSVIQKVDSVTVSYVAPTVDSASTNFAVQDLLGNDALSFSNQAVTNNSNIDTVRPELSLVARPTWQQMEQR